MDAGTRAHILDALERMIAEAAPESSLRAMYGGSMIELEPGNAKSRVGGFFASKNHVSMEFSLGAVFDDPKGLLEGTGKQRRHLKLQGTGDITAKGCRGFMDQAIALYRQG